MSIPFFYIPNYNAGEKTIILDEDTSRHVVNVLRMKPGEKLNLTDGAGTTLLAGITRDHKKHCEAEIINSRFTPHASRRITIAISLIKNSSRFEWFLEKATEIGIQEIIPLICERTVKEKFRIERMKGIMISAMLQSQQSWLPILHEPLSYQTAVGQSHHDQKFIAHCMEKEKCNLSDLVNESLSSQIILIGPEGDFTQGEVELAMQHHFTGVALGDSRLRTETAGVVAATILKMAV